jgi:hypothetical protein
MYNMYTLPLISLIYFILSAIVIPYHKLAIKLARFSSEEMPCIVAKEVFSFCISSEWGAGS